MRLARFVGGSSIVLCDTLFAVILTLESVARLLIQFIGKVLKSNFQIEQWLVGNALVRFRGCTVLLQGSSGLQIHRLAVFS